MACGQPNTIPHPRDETIINSYDRDRRQELIPLTVKEIWRLHALYDQPRHSWRHDLHWSQ
jgi:hypothetical protein